MIRLNQCQHLNVRHLVQVILFLKKIHLNKPVQDGNTSHTAQPWPNLRVECFAMNLRSTHTSLPITFLFLAPSQVTLFYLAVLTHTFSEAVAQLHKQSVLWCFRGFASIGNLFTNSSSVKTHQLAWRCDSSIFRIHCPPPPPPPTPKLYSSIT